MEQFAEIMTDFLQEDLFISLQKSVMSDTFPWYYSDYGTCHKNYWKCEKPKNMVDRPQFTHEVFGEGNIKSNLFVHFAQLIKNLENKKQTEFFSKIIRIKANMILRDIRNDSSEFHMPHTDSENKCVSLLYYLNDSDGDTFIFNENKQSDNLTVFDKICPQENKAVFFNSSYLHASSSPIVSERRVVVNVVFKNDAS